MSDSGNINVGDDAKVYGPAIGRNDGAVNTTYNITHKHAYAPHPPLDLAAAQALLDRMPLDVIPAPTALPTPHRMPLRRNPQFVGRAEDLMALAAALKAGGVAAITTGIGGVGKTQLAAEFAHRYGQFFAGGVFWLSFADPTGVAAELAACGGAGALELYAEADGLSQAEQVAKVGAAWAQDLPRLLIFDNCDDAPGTTAEQQLAAWLPTSGGCRVLVTSRRGQWRSSLGIMAHHLDTLPRAESIALLRSHCVDISDAAADAMAAELGDLPLALNLAGNYLDTYRDEPFGQPAAYLANLQKQLIDHRSMQGKGVALSLTDHDLNVRATFELSYDRLNKHDPTDALAIAALARAACLAPGEPFPRELLLATLGEATEDEEIAAQRADAIRRLVALGLVEDTAGATLRVHRLIVAFAQVASTDDTVITDVEDVLMTHAYQIGALGYPVALLSILVHVRHVIKHALESDDLHAAPLFAILGYYLRRSGRYAEARPLFERALEIRERVLGADHPQTATSLNNLAALFKNQGAYAEARPLIERALAITKNILGPDHPQTASSLNNLALLLDIQGDHADALPLFEQALEIRERMFGVDHPQTATSLNNIAALFAKQGDYTRAQPLYERAMHIREHVLGSQHPDTAASLSSLAALLHAQGDVATAQQYYERALSICEIALGSNHPKTAQNLQRLAILLQDIGDYAGAYGHFQHAITIYLRILGPQHPTTQQCQRQLDALDSSSPIRDQQIAAIAAHAESAVAQALADLTSDRAALID
jgi:tetratricopeptide (TPR) repeat protein